RDPPRPDPRIVPRVRPPPPRWRHPLPRPRRRASRRLIVAGQTHGASSIMCDFHSARLTLAAAFVGLGLSTAAWAEPPAPPYVDPVVDAIKPLPLVPIPDDPPPHEGAMID